MPRNFDAGNGGRTRRRLASARRRVEFYYPTDPPGRASKYIRHVDDLPRGRLLVVFWCRVSAHGAQEQRGNVGDQEKWLRRVAARYHFKIIAVFRRIESGQDLDRGTLAGAIEFARKHDAILLAESTDRFVRHPNFHPKNNPDAQAIDRQFRELAELADGVTLATALDPDATPAEVRSQQRKRGQWAKGKPGGRPKRNKPGYKKRRRQRLAATVNELRRCGVSEREIKRQTGVPRATQYEWARRRWLDGDAY